MTTSSVEYQKEDKPDDGVILVMGMEEAQKRSFVQLFTQATVEIGIGLGFFSSPRPRRYLCHLPNDSRNFWLAYAPGIAFKRFQEHEALEELSGWLIQLCEHKTKLRGIIYMQSIHDRIDITSLRYLQIFRKLYGENNLECVALVTTRWDTVDKTLGLQREQHLNTIYGFWKDLISKGAQTFRHDEEQISGQKIILSLLNRNRNIECRIQREMIDQKKTLAETTAGLEVLGQIEKVRVQHENEVSLIKRSRVLTNTEEVVTQGQLSEWIMKSHEAHIQSLAREQEVERSLVKYGDALCVLRYEMYEAMCESDRAVLAAVQKTKEAHEDLFKAQMEEQRRAHAQAQENWQTREAEQGATLKKQQEQITQLMQQVQALSEQLLEERRQRRLEMREHADRQEWEIDRLRHMLERQSLQANPPVSDVSDLSDG